MQDAWGEIQSGETSLQQVFSPQDKEVKVSKPFDLFFYHAFVI